MSTDSPRFVRTGLRSAAAATALALTLPLAPTAAAQDVAQELLPEDSLIQDVVAGATGFPPMGAPSIIQAQEDAPVDENGAPIPQPFPADFIARAYPSDMSAEGIFYHSVVDPFRDLEENHPEILEQNLEIVVAINNAARDDREAQLLALADDHDNPLVNLSAGFGANLGAHFRDAFAEGRLPKTTALLSGNLARAAESPAPLSRRSTPTTTTARSSSPRTASSGTTATRPVTMIRTRRPRPTRRATPTRPRGPRRSCP